MIEIVPPYVQTGLMGEAQAKDPNAMPLQEYIAETMKIFKDPATVTEALVKRVQPLRFAEADGQEKYQQFFKKLNESATARHKDKRQRPLLGKERRLGVEQ